jgi:hypothetical protein
MQYTMHTKIKDFQQANNIPQSQLLTTQERLVISVQDSGTFLTHRSWEGSSASTAVSSLISNSCEQRVPQIRGPATISSILILENFE